MSTQDAATGGRGGGIPDRAGEPSAFDTSVAHPARVYDYWLGGKDNFAADREAAEQAVAATRASCAGCGPTARSCAARCATSPASRDPAVPRHRHRIPTDDNTHQVAQGSRRKPGSSTWTTTRSCWRTPAHC